MNFSKKLENKIEETEKRLKELAIHLEKIDREYQELLLDLQITPQMINEYMGNEDNFPEPIKQEIEAEKKKLDEKLTLDLSRIKDPLKAELTTAERGSVQQHWLFVR